MTAVLLDVNGWRVYIPEVCISCGKTEPHGTPTPAAEGGGRC
jgi:hypothetical protein